MSFVYLYTQGVWFTKTTLLQLHSLFFTALNNGHTAVSGPLKWDTSPELKYVLVKGKCHFMHLQSFHSVTDSSFFSKSNAIKALWF